MAIANAIEWKSRSDRNIMSEAESCCVESWDISSDTSRVLVPLSASVWWKLHYLKHLAANLLCCIIVRQLHTWWALQCKLKAYLYLILERASFLIYQKMIIVILPKHVTINFFLHITSFKTKVRSKKYYARLIQSMWQLTWANI